MTVRITAVGGGKGAAEYLWNACAEEVRDEVTEAATRGDAAEYYQAAAERGEAPGLLAGGQLRRVGLWAGDVPDKDTAMRLLRCKDPETDQQLGRQLRVPPARDDRLRAALRAAGDVSEEQARLIARQVDKTSHPGTAFYDVTFASSKSVSVYYGLLRAAGHHELADKVLSVHNDSVQYAMQYMEQHTWTRTGSHGKAGGASTGRMEHVGEHMRMHFQHSTSREKDPHLHTHVAVINRVQCADGQWRAVHGQAWKPHKATVAAMYEAKVAELLEKRTPARMVVREDGMAREILGLDPTIIERSSQRSVQVKQERARFLAEFRERQGREPTPAELRKIDRKAGLASRAAKDGTGPAQQFREWAARMEVELDEQIEQVHQAGLAADFWRVPASGADLEAAAVREALVEVQTSSATWDVGVLTAAIANRLPPEQVERAEELAREATGPDNRFGVVDLTRRDLPNVPGQLTDHRDRPVWRDPALDGAKFALTDHLRAETQLVAAARAHTVTPWSDEEIAELREQWRKGGSTISGQQADAVCAVLQSPRAGDVLVAAAGTGKSFLAGHLAEAWRSRGGAVIGTATSQIATSELAKHTGEALNTTRLLQTYSPDHPEAGERLPAGSLVLLDEANMTSTDQLRRVQQVAQRDGAKVLFFGDTAQLDAVGAGGGLELLAREVGTVAELTEARRFEADWEQDASIRLREGDTSVLDEYERHGRLHGGTREAMVGHAVDRYVAAVVQGRSAALITATNAEAAEMSGLVQQRLASLGRLSGEVVGTGMDDNLIAVGDRIQWRENVHTVDAVNGGSLTNREFLQVTGTDERGRVQLTRESDGTAVAVPGEWLTTRAVLGYCGTEHAWEGTTVDEAHTLTPGYVAMTRGRVSNDAWLTTQVAADEHGEAVQASPRELFEQRFSPEGKAQAAIQTWRDERDAERHTATLSAAWETTTQVAVRDATTNAVRQVLGHEAAERVGSEQGLRALTTALERAELSGHQRETVLREAVDSRPLDRAEDLAAVLAWRVDRTVDQRAPERDASTWQARAQGLADRGELGDFLLEVGRRLDERVQELGERALSERPQWALAQLGEPGEDREEWVTRAGRIAAYRERAGVSDALPSVGARPHGDDVAQQAAWRDAAVAAGRPVDEAEYHSLPDSDLEALRSRWRRAAAAAPAFVEPELGRAHDQRAQAEADASMLRTAAEVARSEADRIELLRRAETRERDAEIAAERTRMLSELHAVRQAWMAQHEAEQDAALEAERELKRRGKELDGPQQEPQQTELFGIETEREAPPEPECERDPERDVEQLTLDLQVPPDPVADTVREPVEVVTEVDVEPEREPDPGWTPDRHPALETMVEPERQPAPEPAREEPAVEPVVDEHQAHLVAVEPTARDVARQQPIVSELDEDQTVDQVHTEALQVWEMVGRAEDMRRTLAEAEARARYAQQQMQSDAADEERVQMVARDEAEAELAPQAEPERDSSESGLELGI